MTIIWCMVPEIMSATDRFFCHCGPFFAPLPPSQPKILKFWKNLKKTWRYYHFTHAYHKLKSYDVWFLRYQVWQTEFFVILDNFLPIHPLKTKKNQNFQKMKKNPWRYHPFTQVYQKSRSYDILFLRYGTWWI